MTPSATVRPAYLHWADKGASWTPGASSFTATSSVTPEMQPVLDSGLTIAWVPGNSFYYGVA